MKSKFDIEWRIGELRLRRAKLKLLIRDLARDGVDHYMATLELKDINDELEMLKEDLDVQAAWDRQNIFGRE